MYKCLATYGLPEEVIEYFALTDITEENPMSKVYKKDLHICLDERDNRTEDMVGSTSKGFTVESLYTTFPSVPTRPSYMSVDATG